MCPCSYGDSALISGVTATCALTAGNRCSRSSNANATHRTKSPAPSRFKVLTSCLTGRRLQSLRLQLFWPVAMQLRGRARHCLAKCSRRSRRRTPGLQARREGRRHHRPDDGGNQRAGRACRGRRVPRRSAGCGRDRGGSQGGGRHQQSLSQARRVLRVKACRGCLATRAVPFCPRTFFQRIARTSGACCGVKAHEVPDVASLTRATLAAGSAGPACAS